MKGIACFSLMEVVDLRFTMGDNNGSRRSLNTVINCQPQAYNAARDLSLSTNCARINSQTYDRKTLLGGCAADALRRARHRRLATRRPSDRCARSIGLLPDRRRAEIGRAHV